MDGVTRRQPGPHFLGIPGPTPLPDRVRTALMRHPIDHRGPELRQIVLRTLHGMRAIFRGAHCVVMYPSSGMGGLEAALVNSLAPGDRVLFPGTGYFSDRWRDTASTLGFNVDEIVPVWGQPVDPNRVEEALRADKDHAIKAVCVCHNETSTGVLSDLCEIRMAIDTAGHPALFMADAISSLVASDFNQAAWGVDVAVTASQKGLMLPAGLAFNGLSELALDRNRQLTTRSSYFSWTSMLAANAEGVFPYTPPVSLLFALDAALDLIDEDGLDNIIDRHMRRASAVRIAFRTLGLELMCQEPSAYSPSVTGAVLPAGHDAAFFRKLVLDQFNLSLATGLGAFAKTGFRLAHLGDINELTVLASLSGIEMGLAVAGVPHRKGGAQAAMDHFTREGADIVDTA